MSNIERAAEIIGREYMDAMSGPTPSAWRGQIVEALDDAGLLAPDLPEPDKDSTFAFLGPTWEARKADGGAFIVTSRHGRVRTPGGEHSPAEARARAYALLAAANHAEKDAQ